MTAFGDPPAHAIDMQLHIGETHEPDMHGQPGLRGALEQRGDRLAAERGFKSKHGTFIDRSLQQSASLVPSRSVKLRLR